MLALLAPATASASGRRICEADRFDTKPRMGSGLVARKNAGLIRCATRRWHVAGGARKAIATFRCESSLWSWAHNGRYLGVAQIGAWRGAVHRWLRRTWFNEHQWRRVRRVPGGAYLARANILAAVHWASRGWGPWTCA